MDTFGHNINKIEEGFIEENKDLMWINGKNKGYVQLTISNKNIKVNYHYVSTVKSNNYMSLEPVTFTLDHNQPLNL